MIKTGILGNRAEKLAAKHLGHQGLTLIEKNYRCKLGEIDLVMKHKAAYEEYLVFVEVRHRKSQSFGGALESVGQHKQTKLRRAAEHYLVHHKLTDCAARFDILCVNGDLNKPEFEWIQNAF